MVEEGGKALAAYLRPREDGTIKIEPADEISDMVKTLRPRRRILAVRSAARDRDPDDARQGLSRALGGCREAAVRRERSAGHRARSAGQAFRRSGMVVEPVLRLHQAGLSAQHAMGRAPGEERAGPRPAYPPEGRVLHPAARECGLAVEFPADQSRADARHAERERRESGARHEDAGRGHRGGPGLPQDPPVGRVEVRGRQEPRR